MHIINQSVYGTLRGMFVFNPSVKRPNCFFFFFMDRKTPCVCHNNVKTADNKKCRLKSKENNFQREEAAYRIGKKLPIHQTGDYYLKCIKNCKKLNIKILQTVNGLTSLTSEYSKEKEWKQPINISQTAQHHYPSWKCKLILLQDSTLPQFGNKHQ